MTLLPARSVVLKDTLIVLPDTVHADSVGPVLLYTTVHVQREQEGSQRSRDGSRQQLVGVSQQRQPTRV